MASASSQSAPPPIGTALRDAKRAVRDEAQAVRDALPASMREAASVAIAGKILALRSFAAARAVLVTIPFRSEWNARLVAAAALATGKVVVSPRVDPVARMLTLHRIADLDADVAPGYRGIPEPLAHCPLFPADAIDWVLVPGVAFDAAGRRLGYGGGYYDRLLPLVPRSAPRIAGAFDVQLVAAVPTGPHDLIVDLIVTETRVIAIDPAADI
jgi:5-formyltetrahydrofolate cyclo-ligase